MVTVTGATGRLGRLVISMLLATHATERIVAVVRRPDKAQALFPRSVELREASYERPETLTPAFDGADRVLFISSSEVGDRRPQHLAVIEAAKRAGANRLVYTSLLHANTSGLRLAIDHRATERAIRASGIPSVILRNGFYFENQTEQLATALEQGEIVGCAGDGLMSCASRADFAEAAVKALVGTERDRTYELAGDHAYSQPELAAEVTRQSGKPVHYRNVEPSEHKALLLAAGLTEPMADMLVDNDRGIARGDLRDDGGQLRRLLGRRTTPLTEAVEAGLASLPAR